MTSRRIPLKGGDEYNILTDARKLYKYTEKPGVCKAVKKKYNKRLRQVNKEVDYEDPNAK